MSNKSPRIELTIQAIGLGAILAVVMGAANVYLGLKAGMTVSASIPAAVIAMAVLQGVFRRKSILEANMVQTGASAGESLAAGIIFTMPALVMAVPGGEPIWSSFSDNYWTITLVAFAGGMLGILFMIPMRRVFIVDSPELPFPEAKACAEVLRAGETDSDDASSGIKIILAGLVIGGLFKLSALFLGLIKSTVEWATVQSSRVFYIGSDTSPALVCVGVIVGLPIAFQIFMGGAIGWLITMPMLASETQEVFGSVIVKHWVGGKSFDGIYTDTAWGVWSSQIRYLGVGAMLVGGFVSLWKVRKGLVAAVSELFGQFKPSQGADDSDPTKRDMPISAVLGLGVLCTGIIIGVYYRLFGGEMDITLITASLMIVLAFFFTAVASYIVGLVGNSNSPTSGMTIMALLATALLIYLMDYSGAPAIIATLGVAGIVCCAAATSGDVCNDLKTGQIIGSTPRSQQIMQVIAVLVSCFVMVPVLQLLQDSNKDSGGIGGKELPAPQAKLMQDLTLSFFGEPDPSQADTPPIEMAQLMPHRWSELPSRPKMMLYGATVGFSLLLVNVFLGLAGMEYRFHVMPVAVGMYLPLGLSVPILIGGFIHFFINRNNGGQKSEGSSRSVLAASGVIAGESLCGIGLGLLVYMNIDKLGLGSKMASQLVTAISIVAFVAVCVWLFRVSKSK